MRFIDAIKEAKFVINSSNDIVRVDPHYSIPLRWLGDETWEPFSGKIVKEYKGLYELRHNSQESGLMVDTLSGVFMNQKVRVTIEEIK